MVKTYTKHEKKFNFTLKAMDYEWEKDTKQQERL